MVMRIALKLGASFLSAPALDDLADWVDLRLLAHVELRPAAWMPSRAGLTRIRRDIEHLEVLYAEAQGAPGDHVSGSV
jgi:hypothetical protein